MDQIVHITITVQDYGSIGVLALIFFSDLQHNITGHVRRWFVAKGHLRQEVLGGWLLGLEISPQESMDMSVSFR